jgi:hypothetical protein
MEQSYHNIMAFASCNYSGWNPYMVIQPWACIEGPQEPWLLDQSNCHNGMKEAYSPTTSSISTPKNAILANKNNNIPKSLLHCLSWHKKSTCLHVCVTTLIVVVARNKIHIHNIFKSKYLEHPTNLVIYKKLPILFFCIDGILFISLYDVSSYIHIWCAHLIQKANCFFINILKNNLKINLNMVSHPSRHWLVHGYTMRIKPCG